MKKRIFIANKPTFLKLTAAIAALALTLVFFAGATAQAATAPQFGNYFVSDYDTKRDAYNAAKDVAERIVEEGVTMLKNEDNALPLGPGAKISLFGKTTKSMLYGGSGSAAASTGGDSVTLHQALTDEGFALNPDLISFYENNSASGSGRGGAPTNGNVPSGYNTGETPVASYTPALEGTYSEYGDAAVVMFSRVAGEGFDLPRTMTWNGSNYGSMGANLVPGARYGTDHYLQLDQNESDLLKYLGGKFDKVVVLLNTGSQFETGFLDDPGHYGYHANIKAALWIGYPGATGVVSLAKILSGAANPSGRTVDTYARDFKADPSWQNFANNRVNKGNQYTNRSSSGGIGGGGYAHNYIEYKEGIYMGYRYWETRGYEEGFSTPYTSGASDKTTTTEWDSWYDAHVVRPFGYGLSYTTFSWTDITPTIPEDSALTADQTIEVSVKVTNTGTAAGKDVVQLYYTAPYIDGGIEKSHVVLGAFEKTGIIEPGEYETVTLTMPVRQMASYDFNDANENSFKGYELDPGDYVIRISKNAHESVDDIDYTVGANIQYETDDNTGNPVGNLFDEVSDYITDNGRIYMTRSDFEGTFPTTTLNQAAPQAVVDALNEWVNNTPANAYTDSSQPWYVDPADLPTTGASNGLMLADLVGVPYDDPLWDDYMDQFTPAQMGNIARQGSYSSGNSGVFGLPYTINADSPMGWANTFGRLSGGFFATYGSETLTASTWNKELARQKGEMIGEEGLWGNGGAGSRVAGWYAPAVNTHRSPFGGRNFEYYSEDGVLAGILAAEVVKGARAKGVFSFVKHFAVNDQETNRCGLLTWANEQSMREIYFKPFEICVKEGKTLGIMSALNRLGPTWVGGDYRLLTQLLRDEWGFEGMVVTDSFLQGELSNINLMILSGGNLSLGNAAAPGGGGATNDNATYVTALRNAVKGICYAHANSLAMNTASYPVTPPVMTYSGALLDMGLVDIPYTASVATAAVSWEVLGIAPDDANVVYTVKEGTDFPDWLTLAPSGALSGTPTEEASNIRLTVVASYTHSDTVYSKEASFTLTVIDPNGSIVYPEGGTLADGAIGSAYSASVDLAYILKPDATPEEIAEFPPVTYELKQANFMPSGLTLNSDGTVTGTPDMACIDYGFTVVASAIGYKDREATFTLSVYHSLSFTAKTLAVGKFGEGYLDRVQPAVGDVAVTYKLKEGTPLPSGLSLTAAGYITGTPQETVTDKTFTVIADGGVYTVAKEAEYSITIGIAFGYFELAAGKAGQEYYSNVDMAQGAAGISYALKEGSSLPEGITLAANGDITGTPVKAGITEFTVVASANGFVGDEITLTLYIANGDASTAPGTDGNTDGDGDNDGNEQPPAEDSGCKNAGFAESLIGFALFISLSGAVVAVKRRKKKRE
ncbi:MAG: glycoside hydrolase family 3 C-terminal domain-containing protein [Clostridiales bacterium]|jgi:beta-glucosidase|nr:glycoside hydrolase family 3 C-terminal domain-containing protein [Clostridiales bacterium]